MFFSDAKLSSKSFCFWTGWSKRHYRPYYLIILSFGLLSPLEAHDSSGIYVEIRRTSYGIPHIKAREEESLGYGIGYAYAEDNFCLLANEVMTVNGERSRYLGGDLPSGSGMSNLSSDFFYRWLNDDRTVMRGLQTQPKEIRDLLRGYAAGYNRYLRDTGADNLPKACKDELWIRPITDGDLIKIMRRLTVENGLGRFAGGLVSAQSPLSTDKSRSSLPFENGSHLADVQSNFETDHGSNAIALGRTMTDNGRGLLLGNPHFPWSGALRFYQMHLTIPGVLDVMGAGLPGLPVVNIGFSRNIAWTHTVDASSHFTVYHLKLDAHDPTKYLLDDQVLKMKKVSVAVDVREGDGTFSRKTHDFYETRFGPVLNLPGQFEWSRTDAFALRDANSDNLRAIQQWYSMDRSRKLDDFEHAIDHILGIPWVNTIAVDSKGTALFMNVSAMPDVDPLELADCHVQALPAWVLDGSRTSCEWKTDPGAPVADLLDPIHLSVLRRDDYVQNSNGGTRFTNPSESFHAFSPLVSDDNAELNGRTRYALNWLDSFAAGHDGAGRRRVLPQDLQNMVMGDQVYSATLVIDDLNALCRQHTVPIQAENVAEQIPNACNILQNWNRTASDDSNIGYLVFELLMNKIRKIPNVWREPFDPARAISTPAGLNITDPSTRTSLLAALSLCEHDIAALKLPYDATWGQIQVATKGIRAIPIHGGASALGVYNVIESRPSGNGRREVISGSSYIQVVAFDETGPNATGLLTFSESSNPESPHYADQTELFAKKQWINFPFSEAAILADPHYQSKILTDPELTK